jgi:hypothetical protein
MLPQTFFKRRNRQEETNDQIVVVRHLKIYYPDCLFTIAPSGMKLPKSVAVRLKRMGYRKGTPDILIFEARKGFHGLLIELKKLKGGTKEDSQEEFCQMAIDRGYKSVFAEGSKLAIDIIEDYLGPSLKAGMGTMLVKQ